MPEALKTGASSRVLPGPALGVQCCQALSSPGCQRLQPKAKDRVVRRAWKTEPRVLLAGTGISQPSGKQTRGPPELELG